MLRPVLCVILCLFLYGSAKADTFVLTSGGMSTSFGQSGINASGPGISIQAASGGSPGNLTFATCLPAPCGPGSTLNVGGVWNPSTWNIGFQQGTVTLNGVTFQNVIFSGQLNFTGSVVLPSDFVNDHAVNVPFTMEGQLIGFIPCQPEPFVPCQQVFDIDLVGSGIASANFQFFGTRSVSYAFTDPVPEPATLGLLGVGLLALGRRIRKRR